jgi:hypothetical protein
MPMHPSWPLWPRSWSIPFAAAALAGVLALSLGAGGQPAKGPAGASTTPTTTSPPDRWLVLATPPRARADVELLPIRLPERWPESGTPTMLPAIKEHALDTLDGAAAPDRSWWRSR